MVPAAASRPGPPAAIMMEPLAQAGPVPAGAVTVAAGCQCRRGRGGPARPARCTGPRRMLWETSAGAGGPASARLSRTPGPRPARGPPPPPPPACHPGQNQYKLTPRLGHPGRRLASSGRRAPARRLRVILPGTDTGMLEHGQYSLPPASYTHTHTHTLTHTVTHTYAGWSRPSTASGPARRANPARRDWQEPPVRSPSRRVSSDFGMQTNRPACTHTATDKHTVKQPGKPPPPSLSDSD